MIRIYCLITGEDYRLLKNETPYSKKKVALLANTLLIPVMVWAFAGWSLISEIFKGGTEEGILASVGCAFFIFIIERCVIMSQGNRIIMWVRIGMGLITSILGAFILDEIIFKNDIEQQMVIIKTQYVGNQVNYKMTARRAELDSLENVIKEKYEDWRQTSENAMSEADGTGGSKIRGVSDIATVKIEAAKKMEMDYKEGVTELTKMKEEFKKKEAEVQDETEKSFRHDALLIRTKALWDLIWSNKMVAIVYLLFTVLLTLCEFLVIIMKKSTKVSNYERKVQFIEEIGKNRLDVYKNIYKPFDYIDDMHPYIRKSHDKVMQKSQKSYF